MRVSTAYSVLAIATLLASCATSADPPAHRAMVRVDFTAERIESARAAGLAAPGRLVSTDDPVRVASISKLIVALGVMRLVEAGKLDLDRDVSDYLGWSFRNPAFPGAAISLRQLLSHTSSLTDGGDYIVPLGTGIREFLGPRSWDAAHAPGSYFRYTNLNFGIIGTVIERATGERFDHVMTREVFEPLGLDACFNWSGCSDAAIAGAVVLYAPDGSVRRDDLRGRTPECLVVPATDGSCNLGAYRPGSNGALFSPQGGARISMNSLARIGQLLLGRGVLDGKPFIGASTFDAMTGAAWTLDDVNGETEGGFYCAHGLGVMIITNDPRCRDNPFGDRVRRLGHAGEAYNLRSGLWVDPQTGKGTAFFLTAVADDAKVGGSAYTRDEEQVAKGR